MTSNPADTTVALTAPTETFEAAHRTWPPPGRRVYWGGRLLPRQALAIPRGSHAVRGAAARSIRHDRSPHRWRTRALRVLYDNRAAVDIPISVSFVQR